MADHFSPEVADKLLDKLSSDDDFRAAFQNDPHAALASIGHVTAPSNRGVAGADPVMCCGAGQPLASKEQIRASRAVLQKRLQQFNQFDYFNPEGL